MTLVTLRQESLEQGDFYVPQFEVKIAGVGLPRDVLRDVTQITYKDNIKEIDSFELTVSNWDPATQSFKYIGSDTPESLNENPLHTLFEPCKRPVEVSMGYVGRLGMRRMLTGSFTTMEPNFPSGGAPTLAVRGLNKLHQLRRKQYTTTWGDTLNGQPTTDSGVALDIAGRKDDEGQPRFPMTIVVDKEARQAEPHLPYLAQQNQYDIDFLLTRARERGYVVFIQETDAGPHLYFGPSQGGEGTGLRSVTYALKWGLSLIDFKPTLTTANQIKSVTVRGWNRSTRQAITAKVDIQSVGLNPDLRRILQACGDAREEIVVDEPVYTLEQAKAKARAILTDRYKLMVKASGTCVGLPDLRAGQRVQIEGLGTRLNGTYFVTDTTHTIGDGGYTTRFNARREQNERGEAQLVSQT